MIAAKFEWIVVLVLAFAPALGMLVSIVLMISQKRLLYFAPFLLFLMASMWFTYAGMVATWENLLINSAEMSTASILWFVLGVTSLVFTHFKADLRKLM